MSSDGNNIVKGRIRRWAAVHGRTFNPCEKQKQIPDIDKDFPAGLRVKHKESGKVGTVQPTFGGPPSCYDPWEVPVKWDGDEYTSGVNYESLIKTYQERRGY